MNTPIESHAGALLDIDGACRYLGVGRTTLYELRKAGKIPEVHLTDHCVRFRRSDLDEFVGRRLEKPAAFSITSSRS